MRQQLAAIERKLSKIQEAPLLARAAMAQSVIGDVVKLQYSIIEELETLKKYLETILNGESENRNDRVPGM